MDVNALSRRELARILGIGGIGAIAAGLPRIGRAATAAATASSTSTAKAVTASAMDGLVRLNANENPYGAAPEALAAMQEVLGLSCHRYPYDSPGALQDEVAQLHGVAADQILLGNGSSEILELAVAAYASPSRPAVVAEPTFEVVWLHAKAVGDRIAVVPLTADHHHDLPRMLAAAPAGLIYLCNPNNPTATVTPKGEVRALLEKAPKETVVLVDEAYFHYADDADYESVIPLVREHPNLLVLRTFSKVYGLAGLRCGYAVAQAPLLETLHRYEAFNNLNIVAVAGARVAIRHDEHVAACKAKNRAARDAAVADLATLGYKALPSQANFFFVDLKRPAAPIIHTLRTHGIAVGRSFAAAPTFLRVSVGTADQMKAFGTAFRSAIGEAKG